MSESYPEQPIHVLPLGPMSVVTVQAILRGEVVEAGIWTENDGEAAAWLTPGEAYELAEALMDAADEAVRMAESREVTR
jgi:hypothetical protein